MSSYRSYVPWSKSSLGSSYSGSGSSYSGAPKSSESASAKPTVSDSKNDSGYTGRRYGSTASTTSTGTGTGTTTTSRYPSSYTSTDRSASTPSKYGTSTSSSSSSYLLGKDKDKYSSTTTPTPTPTKDTKENDRPSIREKYNMGPALPSSPPKSVKEASDKPAVSHRQSLIDKYSTSRTMETPRSYSSGAADKKDETPSSGYSRSLSRTPAKPEPEPEKTTGYSSTLSPYRLYGRTSSPYTRSTSRDESAASSTSSTPATTPITNPTSLRYGRYSITTASPRSPVNDRPSVTSPTPEKYRSGRTSRQEDEEIKTKETKEAVDTKPKEEVKVEAKVEMRSVAVVTRGTSPTAPSTSSFLRTRRADLARVIEKTVERPVARPVMVDKEIQSDRGDDTARLSRYGSTSRSTVSPWSSYLDRLPSAGGGYSPTVAKYSTRSYGTGYGSTTPRGDREATVTTTSPTPTPSVVEVPKAAPSAAKLVKEETKETVRPVEPAATAVKTDKQDASAVSMKEDDVNLSKAKTKAEIPGLKRAPSFTRVGDVVLKRVTKADGDNKSPATKKTEESSKTATDFKIEAEKKPETKKVEGTEKTTGEVKLSVDKKPVASKVEGADKTPVMSKPEPEKVSVSKKVESKTEDSSVVKKAGDLGVKTTTEKSTQEKKVASKKLEGSTTAAAEPRVKVLSNSPSAAKLEDAKLASASASPTAKSDDAKKSPPKLDSTGTTSKVSVDVVVEDTKKSSAVGGTKEPLAGAKPSSTDIQKQEEPKVEDIDVLKGALAGLIRANTEKPPIKKSIAKVDSLSESESEGVKSKTSSSPSSSVSEKKKPLKKLITKTDSLSETESENLKMKSPSPSLSESEKLKTPPLSPPPTIAASLAKLGSPSTNRKFLPPPVPRADGKTSPSQHSLNKDFRKSALNTDVSPSEAEELKKQRLASKGVKKTKRSASASSDDASESSEAPVTRGGSAPSVGTPESPSPLTTSKSLSNAKMTSTTSPTTLDPKKVEPARKSRSPSAHKSASSSEESDSSEESTTSSSSDDEAEETPSRSSASNMIQSSKSPSIFDKNKSLLSTSSSKCLNVASSADESSLADKPPRPPSSPKPPQKEEAKSFLMRALAPVTNLFKSRTQESGMDTSNENLSENLPRSESTQSLSKSLGSDKEDSKKSESEVKKPHKIRHMESGERAWWLDSSENIPEGVQRIKSSKSISKMSSDSEPDSKKKEKGLRKHKIRHIESGERAWWLESAESIPEDSESLSAPKQSSGSETDSKKKERTVRPHKIRHIESGERAWWLDNNESIPEDSESVSVPKIALNSEKVSDPDDIISGRKLRRQESGERAWWLDSNPNIPEGIERIKSNTSINKLSSESDQDAVQQANAAKLKINRIRRQESGERAWWLDSNSNIPEGVQRIKSSSSVAKSKESSSEADTNAKNFAIRHQESGEKAWWMNSSSDIAGGVKKAKSKANLHGGDKGDRASVKKSESSDDSEESDSSESEVAKNKGALPKFPLESPSGLEATVSERTGRSSPYDNVLDKAPVRVLKKRPKNRPLFISNHTNIDDILGTAASLVDPVTGGSRRQQTKEKGSSDDDEDDDDDNCEEVEATQVRIHDSTAKQPTIRRIRDDSEAARRRQSLDKLDDTSLQLYKDGDYGSYLDLEASISEQQEEFDGFQANRKNSIVLRTQLSVRVHTIIEKLLNSEGRELRRALFSLKQIFQEDKDLVHEFVQNDGLACLIKVGSEADQNYQNYILRALGQVMLYVDGMNGVMDHNRTVQWLYTLIASKFRLVVKTALKLLLVFVEYVDTNCMLLIKAVNAVDSSQGLPSWSNVMRLVKDYDSADTELLTYATTLLNKTLNGVPDQDTYYDQVDALEEQGVEGAIQRYMSKQGTDLDLLRQFQIYEAVLHHEDGEEKGTPLKQLDETVRKTLRNRQSPAASLTLERRKSRRHSTGASPLTTSLHATRLKTPPNNNNNNNNSSNNNHNNNHNSNNNKNDGDDGDETGSSSSRSSPGPGEVPHLNGSYKDKQTDDAGVTPALRRRRERAERQRSFIREQQETSANLRATRGLAPDGVDDENELSQRLNGSFDGSNKLNRVSSRKDLTPLMNAVNKLDSADADADANGNGNGKTPWSRYSKNGEEVIDGEDINAEEDPSGRKLLLGLKRESTVKDLTQKLASQNILNSPTEEKVISRIGDMSGLISKAKEGLAKSKSKVELLKSASGDMLKLMEAKKSETELHWEELVSGMSRPLELCDLDFTDLRSDDEMDVLSPVHACNGIPPPPPPAPLAPMAGKGTPPPPPPNRLGAFVPPPCPTTPTSFGVNLRHQRSSTATSPEKSSPQTPQTPSSKTKKTVKLFWKEVRDDPMVQRLQKTGMIWDELSYVAIDTQKLEHLFESRAKDLITKKQQEMNKTKEIIVLDHKRSNAINIGMTKLPPPRSIKTAILKMDATIMTREGIEKLLTMLPTEDEQSKIQEAQLASPEMPLGSAEQFLLTLASISELSARLKLWAFKLDYENSEKEVAEPLMDLKQGVETLRDNKTFRGILSTLLSIGIFLNGNEVKGFQIEYLAKVPEVKDTVHKHSLLHHLCHMVMEKFPDATDLYSEIGAVTRASKVDFDELAANIHKMESECKASWDHLKDIAKHDGSTIMKVKMTDFLADCAERIIVLGIVHRRVMNRYHKFLLWLGIPLFRVADMKPSEFCRIVSEFALEYRTTRERVLLQLEKKANHRERNKTRGKMITEVGKFRTKEDRADAELRQLLGTHGTSDISDAESVVHGTLPWRRQRKEVGRTVLGPLIRDETVNGNVTDGDDEILESLVKTATKAPGTRTMPRERKRTRHADLRRTLKNGLSEEDKKHLAAYIKGY